MIVVDTHVVAYLYLPGEFTAAAENLLERDLDWFTPVLWRSEFRNILAGYLRRRTLSFDEACALQAEAERLLAGNEREVDSRQVPELAISQRRLQQHHWLRRRGREAKAQVELARVVRQRMHQQPEDADRVGRLHDAPGRVL